VLAAWAGLICWLDHHEGAGTWFGALFTFAAVATAFVVQYFSVRAAFAVQARQLEHDRLEDQRRRARINVAVFDQIVVAHKLCEEARDLVQMVETVKVDEAWRVIGTMDTVRRVLRHYLTASIPLPELVALATSAEQRLFEGRAAMHHYVDTASPGFDQSQSARWTLQSVVDRIRRTLPEVGQAQAKVDKQRALLASDD
jgi:hypothetical protein